MGGVDALRRLVARLSIDAAHREGAASAELQRRAGSYAERAEMHRRLIAHHNTGGEPIGETEA